MNLNIIVHDMFNEIGHSRAMLEVLNALPADKVDHIRFICYTHDTKENLLPHYKGQVSFCTVPFPHLKPFILKSLFFQMYTLLYAWKILLPKSKTITIGVCSFLGDIVNVQFVHKLWTRHYFKINKPKPLKYIYKKVLLHYLDLCEEFYYRLKRPKVVCLSQFIGEDFKLRYNYPKEDIAIAYSSASLSKFAPGQHSRQELYEQLTEQYHQLKTINIDEPIYLFVGAFERKGLPVILRNISEEQLIIIGKPETGSQLKIPQQKNIVHIPFTKSIESFFNMCDCFVFPTSYEPFGLVVIEAAASGSSIIVTRDQVGASELLVGAQDVQFCDEGNLKKLLNEQSLLSQEERLKNYEQRKRIFDQYSWQKAAKVWQQVIES